MPIVIINRNGIHDIEMFNANGYVTQRIRPNDVFYYVTNFEKQLEDIKEMVGTNYLCEIDVPFNYPQDQKSNVERFLNSVLSSQDVECELCIRKIVCIVNDVQ